MIIESIIMLFFLVMIYAVLKLGAPIWSPFVVLSIMEFIIIIIIALNASSELDFPINAYLRRVIFPLLLILIVSAVLLLGLSYFYKACTVSSSLLGVALSVLIELSVCLSFMEKKEYHLLKNIIRR